MNSLTDLILTPDSATAIFFGSLLTPAAVLMLALHLPTTYRPDPISQPMSNSPRLLQGPQLVHESRSSSEIAARGLVNGEFAPELNWRIAVVPKPVSVEMPK
jgi:hypothetical protein